METLSPLAKDPWDAARFARSHFQGLPSVMEQMHELISVAGFDRAISAISLVWLVVGLIVAIVFGIRRQAGRLWRTVAWTSLGPVAFGLWKFYSWMVRVEPETGYVGLHRVSVFAINAGVFVVVGVVLGVLFAKVYGDTGRGEG